MDNNPVSNGWVVEQIRGTAGWALHSSSFNAVSLGSSFFGTQGNAGPAALDEESALMTPAFNTAGAVGPIGIVFDSYTFNEGGCPGGPDSEEVQ
ncbi:MAG: hypothetical protein R3C68_15495 [Myxococcota bacterium]